MQMVSQLSKKSIVLNRWLYIVLGILVMLLLGTVYSYSVFRVALERVFNIGATESGLPYMVALASYAVFMFITGKYIDRYHPRTLLLLGGLLVAFGWILSAFVTNIMALTITYGLISGAGVGVAYGVPMSVIAKWFPDKKGLAVGMVLIGFGLSPLITAPIARYLVQQYGVMQTFLILGISFAMLIPLLALTFKYPNEGYSKRFHVSKQDPSNQKEIPIQEMVKSLSFKGVYLNFIIGTMIGLTMIGMTSNVGIDYFKLEASTVTQLMALFAISNGIGRPIFGWFTDRFSSKGAMLLSYFLIAMSALSIILLTHHIVVYMISFSVFWFNLGGWLAIAPTSTLNLYGTKHYSKNYGLMFTAYGIGAIAGVSTSGMLLDLHSNYHYVFIYVIILCAMGALITAKTIKS